MMIAAFLAVTISMATSQGPATCDWVLYKGATYPVGVCVRERDSATTNAYSFMLKCSGTKDSVSLYKYTDTTCNSSAQLVADSNVTSADSLQCKTGAICDYALMAIWLDAKSTNCTTANIIGTLENAYQEFAILMGQCNKIPLDSKLGITAYVKGTTCDATTGLSGSEYTGTQANLCNSASTVQTFTAKAGTKLDCEYKAGNNYSEPISLVKCGGPSKSPSLAPTATKSGSASMSIIAAVVCSSLLVAFSLS